MDCPHTSPAAAAASGGTFFDFPAEEKKILQFWDSIDAFATSLKISSQAKRPLFTFYDGPPFATGLPHYGHLLAGSIKDIVTRHACQLGFHVERRFGWDCHGLPVEYEIDKSLGITGKDQVLQMGIPAYNDACRSIVLRYTSQWEATVKRVGRWIDFKNDYKTMDPSFMESVWWVFSQLFEKGQVYRGYKVMPYSCACNTPLSNFEANQNYKDVQDPSIYPTFPLKDSEEKRKIFGEAEISLVAWTTTPWTLPSNLALCVNPALEYVLVQEDGGKCFLLLEKACSLLFKNAKVLSKHSGASLKGLAYEPLFTNYCNGTYSGAFHVLCDAYVTDESGTGIVHQAPAFGEDDFRVCLENGIITTEDVPCPLNENGKFTGEFPQFQGMFFKDADKEVIKAVEGMGRMLFKTTLTHPYPFCWRSDTPLIYKAVPSWFVRVRGIIPQLLANNAKTYWVPESVKEKRFHNWLENAHDWAISRNRFWGTPIPLWRSDDWEEIVCINSIAELERLSGVKGIKDLHRETVDSITIPSSKGKGQLKRVEEVLDCWFESGSMPYAQQHFPFENKETFEGAFPAHFIAEGLDQTRGWFYTLMVLSTHLFNKPPFRNLIVNGLVLAADGKKMSKRLKNYPEPTLIIDAYGADALRVYMINSPVVKAENLRFKEEGVKAVLKDVFLPWYNAFKFLTAQIEAWEAGVDQGDSSTSTRRTFCQLADLSKEGNVSNTMDLWILASAQDLIQFVKTEMAAYRLYTVVPRLLSFVEALTNWYVRMNRRRFKGELGAEEAHTSLQVLFEVVLSLCLVMAPFTPFLTEHMWQIMRKWSNVEVFGAEHDTRSIHFLLYPAIKGEFCNPQIERAVARMQSVVEMARKIRETKNISLKVPLKKLSILVSSQEYQNDLESLAVYLQEEVNVRSVVVTQDDEAFGARYKATPNFKALGQRIRTDLPKVQQALKALSSSELKAFVGKDSVEIAGVTLFPDEFSVSRYTDSAAFPDCVSAGNNEILLLLDVTIDEELKTEGLAREVVNRVQRLRKKLNLKPTDRVKAHFSVLQDPSNEFESLFLSHAEYLTKAVKSDFIPLISDANEEYLGMEVFEISEALVEFKLSICE